MAKCGKSPLIYVPMQPSSTNKGPIGPRDNRQAAFRYDETRTEQIHTADHRRGMPTPPYYRRRRCIAEDTDSGNREAKTARAADIPHAVRETPPALHAIPTGVGMDIETTGLEDDCELTCVCIWDGGSGRSWFFRDPAEKNASHTEITQALNDAPFIFAFNGAGFDIPVLARCMALPARVVGGWMAKLVDPSHASFALFGARMSQNLNSFLSLNDLQCKSGTGAEAVALAREEKWAALGAYCMDDARLTYLVINSTPGTWDDARSVRYNPWNNAQIFTRIPDRDGENTLESRR